MYGTCDRTDHRFGHHGTDGNRHRSDRTRHCRSVYFRRRACHYHLCTVYYPDVRNPVIRRRIYLYPTFAGRKSRLYVHCDVCLKPGSDRNVRERLCELFLLDFSTVWRVGCRNGSTCNLYRRQSHRTEIERTGAKGHGCAVAVEPVLIYCIRSAQGELGCPDTDGIQPDAERSEELFHRRSAFKFCVRRRKIRCGER